MLVGMSFFYLTVTNVKRVLYITYTYTSFTNEKMIVRTYHLIIIIIIVYTDEPVNGIHKCSHT